MDKNEIKEIILNEGVIHGSEIIAEKFKKRRDQDSWWWLGVLTFFIIIFIGYLNQRDSVRQERVNKMESDYKSYVQRTEDWRDSVQKYVWDEYKVEGYLPDTIVR